MKIALSAVLFTVALIASSAFAQVSCTTYPSGQTICAPIGGGASSYR